MLCSPFSTVKFLTRTFILFFYTGVGLSGCICLTSYAQTYSAEELCVLEQSELADGNTPISEIKSFCAAETNIETNTENTGAQSPGEVSPSPTEPDKSYRQHRLAISPHKSNYVLPLAYNHTPNNEPFADELNGGELDNVEIEFQISIKVQLFDDVIGNNGDIFVAYTGQSWWQAYNSDLSSPFRETNYEPEVFLNFDTKWNIFGWHIYQVAPGLVHESNGRNIPLSRSWNRFYVNASAEYNNWFVNFKPWYRIPDEEKETPTDTSGDDNPDIGFYMGNFELTTGYRSGEHRLSAMVRNNLRSDNKGAIQLDWSFPLKFTENVRGYLQIFSGYGESLIDYNVHTQRISLGFIVTEY